MKSRERTIYVLSIDAKHCKIGITTNLKNRLRRYKHDLGYTPAVLMSETVPYRCARCIEYGIAWNFEYFDSEKSDKVMAQVGFAINHCSENQCGKQGRQHDGIPVQDFFKNCGMSFSHIWTDDALYSTEDK